MESAVDSVYVTTQFKNQVDDIQHARVTAHSKMRVIDLINQMLTPEQKTRFRQTTLGYFLDMHRLIFQSQLVHNVLMREVEVHGDVEELWYCIGGRFVRFSRQEFALITGLVYGPTFEHEHRLLYRPAGSIRARFLNNRFSISGRQLEECFASMNFAEVDVEEAVRFALVVLVERVLLGRSDSRVIDETLLKLADNLDEFDEYPWGSVVWTETYNSIIKQMSLRAQNSIHRKISNRAYAEEKYSLGGFAFGLMVWMFESIPLAGNLYGVRQNEKEIPRILRWRTRGPPSDRQVNDLFQSQLFNDKSLMLLMPEDREVETAHWRSMLEYHYQKNFYQFVEVAPIKSGGRISNLDFNYNTTANIQKENNDVVMPNVGLDNNLYANILETVVTTVRNELENFKNQIKAEMREEMKLRHMIAMDEIRKPRKVKLESIEGDDDRPNQMEIVGYSKGDACQIDINEEVFQTPENSFSNGGNVHALGRFKRVILKGVWMLCANINTESVGEKNVGENRVDTDELGPVESLLNHMDLDDEISIKNPINTKIREGMWRWIECSPTNIKVKNFWNIEIAVSPDWLRTVVGNEWFEGEHMSVYINIIHLRMLRYPENVGNRCGVIDHEFWALMEENWTHNHRLALMSYEGCFDEAIIKRFVEGKIEWANIDEIYLPINIRGVHWVAGRINVLERTITIYDPALMSFTDDEIVASVHPLCVLMPRFLMHCPGFYVSRRDVNINFDPYRLVRISYGVPQQRCGSGDCGPYVLKIIEYLIFAMPFNFTSEDSGLIQRKIGADIWMAAHAP